MLNFIKDMKNDTLQMLVHQSTIDLLEQFKVNLNELHKLTDEQLHEVKESMINSSGHGIYN